MMEQELERKIEDFRVMGIPDYVPREGRLNLVDNMVATLIGARRAGKSYRVLQVADDLISQKIIKSIEHVCYLDFDNPILSGMGAKDLKLIQNTFLKLTPDSNLLRFTQGPGKEL